MKKSSTVAVIVIIIVIVLAGGAYLLTRGNDNNNTNTTTPTTNKSDMAGMSEEQMKDMNNSGSTDSSDAVKTSSVTIKNMAFSPANITVKKGTTVTWTNNDSITHTVTANNGQAGPNSGNLASGKSYSFTFDKAGTFTYHCEIHPSMTGTVTVTE